MLTIRSSTLFRHGTRSATVAFSSSVPSSSVPETTVPPHDTDHPDIDNSDKNSIQMYTKAMRSMDRHMIYGSTTPLPDPVLPAKPEEISALDPAMSNFDPQTTYVSKRTVHIRQEQKNPSQSPSTKERHWVISFTDEGASGETWSNPLMGWVSASDPMASTMSMQMKFKNAKDAVYFAKKRGWKYEVEKPIMRIMRTDGAQYQDNFLPQDVALKIRKQKTKCDHWHRSAAGASHYFRPLKYHGDGLVPQYGPHGDAPIAPDAEGYYKLR